nr:DUF4270 family protein [Terrimonas ginsenosidimutans]
MNSCRKINEATELGGGLIPPVDNIHTFDTTMDVEAYNQLFTAQDDSSRSNYGSPQVLGYISNDPLFGTTDARMFFELKPTNYPFTFANLPDSLRLDSVVLILESAGIWGDTMVPQTVRVYEMDLANEFRVDTSYLIRQNNFTYSHQLGSKTFLPAALNDSVSARGDSNTVNQLRIRLDDSFGNRFLHYDTTTANNPFTTDSAFRTKFRGFAIQAEAGGNALMRFNLTGANTKLAFYYQYDKRTAAEPNNVDSAVAYFNFKDYNTYFSSGSASANAVTRNIAGTPYQTAVSGTTPDNEVFIQNTPGSYARIKIPGLATLGNRVVHRAELIMEQIHQPVYDSIFPPKYLFLDAYDPAVSTQYNRFIPYDFTFDVQGNPALGALGVAPLDQKNPAGENIKVWKFNISRYIQNVVNQREQALDLRLYAPYYIFGYYKPTQAAVSSLQRVTVNATAGEGRVRLYGGNTTAPSTSPQRMRLRIVYSKL